MVLPCLSFLPLVILSLQEFFFTPFAARGRVSLKRRREGNISKTPENAQPRLKGPGCLSTQDCPWDQKRRGKMGLTWTVQDVCVLEDRGQVAQTSTCSDVPDSPAWVCIQAVY